MMVWITGCAGMLGQEVLRLLQNQGITCVGTDRELDICNGAALRGYWAGLGGSKPDWIVNCAAYTAVDKAEDEPVIAEHLNADGPETLAILAREFGARMIHISTDYVFDGKGIAGADGQLRPYVEADPVAPMGQYGLGKALGEAKVRVQLPEHVIIRTAWLYGLGGPNFVYTMLRLMQQKPELNVVADQWGSPTWAFDLAGVIAKVVVAKSPVYGTFHYSNEGQINWHQFAMAIMEMGVQSGILPKAITVNPISTDQYPVKAKRPAWSVLDKSAIKSKYGVHVPQWQESLKSFLALVKERQGNEAVSKLLGRSGV